MTAPAYPNTDRAERVRASLERYAIANWHGGFPEHPDDRRSLITDLLADAYHFAQIEWGIQLRDEDVTYSLQVAREETAEALYDLACTLAGYAA